METLDFEKWNNFSQDMPEFGTLILVYHCDLVPDKQYPPYWAFRAMRWCRICLQELGEDFANKYWMVIDHP